MTGIGPERQLRLLAFETKCPELRLCLSELDCAAVVGDIHAVVLGVYFNQPAQRHNLRVAGLLEIEFRIAVKVDCQHIAPGVPSVCYRRHKIFVVFSVEISVDQSDLVTLAFQINPPSAIEGRTKSNVLAV